MTAQSCQPPNCFSGPDVSGQLITYLDEEVDETWKVHPRYALRMNHLNEKEKRLFEKLMPEVYHQDRFFHVLDEARKGNKLPNDVLEKLIEPVPPEELVKDPKGDYKRKRYRFISRTEPALDTKQHLRKKLRTRDYLGTQGIPCGIPGCPIILSSNDIRKRHQETQHGILRAKKRKESAPPAIVTRESLILPQASTRSHSVDSTAEDFTLPPHQTFVEIRGSSGSLVSIENNPLPQPIYNVNTGGHLPAPSVDEEHAISPLVHHPQGYGASSHRYNPYFRQPLPQHPVFSPSWTHNSHINSSIALTNSPPNVFPLVESVPQSLGIENAQLRQDFCPYPTNSIIPTLAPPLVPVPVSVPTHSSVQLPYIYDMPTMPIMPPQQPPYYNYNYTPMPPLLPPGLPTPTSSQRNLWPSAIPMFAFVNQAPQMDSLPDGYIAYSSQDIGHRYARKTRSTEKQWVMHCMKWAYNAITWCFSSDPVSRLADAFYLTLALLLTTGMITLLMATIENYTTEFEWLALIF